MAMVVQCGDHFYHGGWTGWMNGSENCDYESKSENELEHRYSGIQIHIVTSCRDGGSVSEDIRGSYTGVDVKGLTLWSLWEEKGEVSKDTQYIGGDMCIGWEGKLRVERQYSYMDRRSGVEDNSIQEGGLKIEE
ncbi:hypothetical protein Tco_1237523 [Tanacetum coccineum]